MANQNWPRDLFGVDMSRTLPQSQTTIGGTLARTPSLVLLPDTGTDGIGLPPIIITNGGTYTLNAATLNDLLLNVAAPVTIQLPSSLQRAPGAGVGISDIGGNLTNYPAVILPYGTELIMGLAEIDMTTPRAGLTLWPIITNLGGWYIK